MIFRDRPYEERIALAASCGFELVEIWTPEGKDLLSLAQAAADNAIAVNNLVVNTPDGSLGGAPVKAADLSTYLERVDQVMDIALAAGIRMGITCSGNLQPGLDRDRMRGNLQTALGRAAEMAAARGFTLVLEALNTLVNHAGYYLDSSTEAADIIREIGNPHLKLLYDVYHMQIMEGNIIDNICGELDVIGHFHAAGVPGRNEIYRGELNYPEIVRTINESGYDGAFGLEYAPAEEDHIASLAASLTCLREGLKC